MVCFLLALIIIIKYKLIIQVKNMFVVRLIVLRLPKVVYQTLVNDNQSTCVCSDSS